MPKKRKYVGIPSPVNKKGNPIGGGRKKKKKMSTRGVIFKGLTKAQRRFEEINKGK